MPIKPVGICICLVVLLLLPASAQADVWHVCATSEIIVMDEVHLLGGEFSQLDIYYEGSVEPGDTIFYDIEVFPPFTSYSTDNMTYLEIFPDEPIPIEELEEPFPVVTYSTDLDWGEPWGPTPFTFTEFGAPGYEISGTIYNWIPEPVTLALVAPGGLLIMRRRWR